MILDLLIMIKRPFADKAKYMRIYEISSPILATIFATWLYLDSASEKKSNSAFFTYLVLYCLIVISGVYSSLTALVDLSKSGISKAIRSLALKRHISLITLYCISNFYIALESYYGLMGELGPDKRPDTTWGLAFLKMLFYLQFIIGPSLRFSEWAFKTALKKTLLRDISFIFCLGV